MVTEWQVTPRLAPAPPPAVRANSGHRGGFVRQVRTALALLGATLCTLAGVALPASTAAASTASSAGSAGSEAGPTTPAPKKLFTIRDERIEESSGLAKSVKHSGIYWTVNDSGDTGPGVRRSTPPARSRRSCGSVRRSRDVEAIGVDRDGTIYIADIGDNKENRDQIEIYTIPEPATLEDESNVKYHRYDFKYPDGAHDAETLLIEPGTSQLYIVTKVAEGHRRDLRGTARAVPRGHERADQARRGAVRGDHRRDVLAGRPTGRAAHVRRRDDGRLGRDPQRHRPRRCAAGPRRDGRGRSHRRNRPGRQRGRELGRLPGARCPPRPPPPRPRSASATPKPATTTDSNNSDSGKSHNLRWIIIGAALFALIITVVTFPPGRRERQDRQAENARLTGQSPPTPHRRQHS